MFSIMSKLKGLKKELDNIIGDEDLENTKAVLHYLKKIAESQNSGQIDKLEDLENRLATDNADIKAILLSLTKYVKGKNIKLPSVYKVFVENQLKLPQYPKGIKVTNFKDFPRQKDINVKKLSEPKWFKKPFKGLIKSSTELLAELVKTVFTVKVKPQNSPRKSIPVRLVSNDGRKFINPFSAVISGGGGRTAFPFKTSTGEKKEALVDSDGKLLIDVADQVESSFDHGKKSGIGGTAVQITASSIVAKQGVEIKAANGNTDKIFVGNADVDADATDAISGFELGAGEALLLKVDNANKIYVISDGTNQTVYFLVI